MHTATHTYKYHTNAQDYCGESLWKVLYLFGPFRRFSMLKVPREFSSRSAISFHGITNRKVVVLIDVRIIWQIVTRIPPVKWTRKEVAWIAIIAAKRPRNTITDIVLMIHTVYLLLTFSIRLVATFKTTIINWNAPKLAPAAKPKFKTIL